MNIIFKEVTVKHLISEDQVRNLLVSALEGGSNYWMCILKYEFPPNSTREDFIEDGKYALPYENPVEGDECWSMAYVLPFMKDGGIVLQEWEENTTHTLTREKMLNGLSVMAEKYPHHFRNLVEENDDAETADVWLQCSLLEKQFMVKKVGTDKELYRKITCKNCASKLEYLPKDVVSKSYSNMCEMEIVSWIVCPECKSQVGVK